MSSVVFVDSNIWVAYFIKEDNTHGRALHALAKIRASTVVFVSSGIVHEVVNYLFKTRGKAAAEGCLDFFLTAPQLEVILPSQAVWQRGAELFRTHNMSLTDAQIIACMEECGEREIYSFDRHFDAVKGIKRLS